MTWTYRNEPLTELAIGAYGFIYQLDLSDGTCYIGKKSCYSRTTLPALKNGTIREGAERVGKNKNGKRVYFDIVTKESKWQDYEGSSDDLDTNLIVSKTVLEFAPTKRSLTYLEEKWLFKLDVLEDENYLNKNIGNRYFKGKLL